MVIVVSCKKIIMRLVFIGFLLLVSSHKVAFSNDALGNLSETQIKSLLCHKWKLTLIEAKGKKATIPASSPEITLKFLDNGQLEETAGKEFYKGTWTYNHSKYTVTTTDKDGKENHVLVDLTNDYLKMKTKFMGIQVMYGMKKVN